MGSFEPTFSYKKGSSLFCITIIVLTNDYGHPHKEVLERLDTCGSEHFCTIDYGAIKIKSNGETIAFDFYKKE